MIALPRLPTKSILTYTICTVIVVNFPFTQFSNSQAGLSLESLLALKWCCQNHFRQEEVAGKTIHFVPCWGFRSSLRQSSEDPFNAICPGQMLSLPFVLSDLSSHLMGLVKSVTVVSGHQIKVIWEEVDLSVYVRLLVCFLLILLPHDSVSAV